ncbi:MAG TPA: ribosomal protein S18-alanine N-acetyltransferase, partial [Nitrospiraceae bacterium]|nr:ribosomal protein S18-alanine N-acetyltransferase [Nitrospiraceae bacterium]
TAHIENADESPKGPRDLVGYVCFWVVFEELRMMNLAVAPRVRRRGIGRWLLQQALAMGREEGARRALLEVRVSNQPAVALYQYAGFSRSGIRTKYYTNPVEDAVLMELEL